jgi:signal transduction histidine kinase
MRASPHRQNTAGLEALNLADAQALHGLLHDLGHDLATLSFLAEAVRGDCALSADTRRLVNLIEQLTSRLLGVVLRGVYTGHERENISARDLLGEIVSLASLKNKTSVALLPAPEVTLRADPALVWRMMTNLVGNAVRAAGPDGHVEVTVGYERGGVIEVADDGPGFGAAATGWASLGLWVVTALANSCGCVVEVHQAEPQGARVRLTFPDELPADRADALMTFGAGVDGQRHG